MRVDLSAMGLPAILGAAITRCLSTEEPDDDVLDALTSMLGALEIFHARLLTEIAAISDRQQLAEFAASLEKTRSIFVTLGTSIADLRKSSREHRYAGILCEMGDQLLVSVYKLPMTHDAVVSIAGEENARLVRAKAAAVEGKSRE